MTELYKQYRPKQFKDILGQDDAVSTLQTFLKRGRLPHALLFTGASGCGKTSLARILQKKLGCAKQDFDEKNAAADRGIETIRQIQSRMSLASLGGGCKIYYLDEAHQATSHAQDCLLKMLEDTPKHVYFFLATTDPGKLKTTIKTRCTEIRVQPLPAKLMLKLLEGVLAKEEVTIEEEVLERIIEQADGSPRKALVLLNQVYRLPDADAQLEAVIRSDSRAKAVEIARLLLYRGKWPQIAKVLKEVDEEPETIRRIILGYMQSVMLGSEKKLPDMKQASRAYLIIQVMRDHVFDCGKAGLTANCFEIAAGK